MVAWSNQSSWLPRASTPSWCLERPLLHEAAIAVVGREDQWCPCQGGGRGGRAGGEGRAGRGGVCPVLHRGAQGGVVEGSLVTLKRFKNIINRPGVAGAVL